MIGRESHKRHGLTDAEWDRIRLFYLDRLKEELTNRGYEITEVRYFEVCVKTRNGSFLQVHVDYFDMYPDHCLSLLEKT